MIKPFAEQPNDKRHNLPSEDFAETRQLLKDEREKNEILGRVNKRLVQSNKALTDMIEDILDDRGLPHA